MVHRIGQSFVAVESVDQENAPVLVQRPRHPDRQRHTDRQVNEVSENQPVHMVPFCFDFVVSAISVITEIK